MGIKYNVRNGVTRARSTTQRLTNKAVFGITTSIAAISLVVVPMAAAATFTTVTESNNQGWIKTEANGGTISYVASTEAIGTGAVQFNTPTNASITRLKKTVSLNLADVTNLSYMTKQVSAPETAKTVAAVNLRLYIDTDGNGKFDDVLVYEPYYNSPVSSIWQTWTSNQTNGYWWSNAGVTYNGHVSVGAGGYTNFHLSDVVHDYQSAKVVSIGLGTGDYNSPWTVQADNLVVNDTTYNFENKMPTVTLTSKNQCKGDGWQSVSATDGSSFKNQGSCVSYVASDDKL